MSTITAADLFQPESRANPYPLYAELRERNEGIHYVEPLDSWAMLRYKDVQRLKQSPAVWSSDMFVEDMGFGAYDRNDPLHQRYAETAARNLMINDAPDHARLRALLSHAFTGKAAGAWTAVIRDIIDEVFESVPTGREVDLVNEIAEVIPVWVISKLIGIPISDRERFRRLSVAFTETFDPTISGSRRDEAIRDSVELFEYVEGIARERRRSGAEGSDVVSILLRAEEEGDKLTMNELVAQTCMLLVAGNETTADLIATGMALFLDHPDAMRDLRKDHDLLPDALLEVLRYESPLQFSPRRSTEDVDTGGGFIPKGSKVFFGHGSANRDPRQFDRPDEFDIRRGDKRHLAFAAGPHFCIGNLLARREASMFFSKFFSHFKKIEPAESATYRTDRLFQYGYQKLPVIISR